MGYIETVKEIAAAVSEIITLLNSIISSKKTNDKEVAEFAAKFKKEVLSPLLNLDLGDCFEHLCSEDPEHRQNMQILYMGINDFCKAALREKRIRNNNSVKDLADYLYCEKVGEIVFLLSAYYQSRSNNTFSGFIQNYELLYDKLRSELTTQNSVFETSYSINRITKSLRLKPAKTQNLARIETRSLELKSGENYIISEKQNKFCKVSVDHIVDGAGVMVWKANRKIIYVNETTSSKNYVKRVNSVSLSMCQEDSRNLSCVKLNRYLTTQDNVKYQLIRVPNDSKENTIMVLLYIKSLVTIDGLMLI